MLTWRIVIHAHLAEPARSNGPNDSPPAAAVTSERRASRARPPALVTKRETDLHIGLSLISTTLHVGLSLISGLELTVKALAALRGKAEEAQKCDS